MRLDEMGACVPTAARSIDARSCYGPVHLEDGATPRSRENQRCNLRIRCGDRSIISMHDLWPSSDS